MPVAIVEILKICLNIWTYGVSWVAEDLPEHFFDDDLEYAELVTVELRYRSTRHVRVPHAHDVIATSGYDYVEVLVAVEAVDALSSNTYA